MNATTLDRSFNRDSSLDALKLIAVITMTIDHIGYLFFPEHVELRLIGRLAYPIFAYLIAQGLRNTSNKYSYIKRLLLFACISQLPFYLAFEVPILNVLFTFTAGAILCSVGLKFLPIALPIYLAMMFFLPFEYSWWGMLVVPTFYFLKNHEMIASAALIIGLFIFAFTEPFYIQSAAIFAFVIILGKPLFSMLCKWPVINKYVFYWYYPVHLALFAMLKMFLFT